MPVLIAALSALAHESREAWTGLKVSDDDEGKQADTLGRSIFVTGVVSCPVM